MPTDWTMYLAYNIGYLQGNIKVRSWAERYTKDDLTMINDVWQPTGTYYIDAEEVARLKAEQEALQAAEKAAQEEL